MNWRLYGTKTMQQQRADIVVLNPVNYIKVLNFILNCLIIKVASLSRRNLKSSSDFFKEPSDFATL